MNTIQSINTDTVPQLGSREFRKQAHESLMREIYPHLLPITDTHKKQSNQKVKIVSRETLCHLKPLVAKILLEKSPRSNIASYYYMLAVRINLLLKPYSLRIPDGLSGLSSRYGLTMLWQEQLISDSLWRLFWWVNFGQQSTQKISIETPRVQSVTQPIPTRIAQVLIDAEKPRRDIYYDFKDFANTTISQVQSKNNREVLKRIIDILSTVVEVNADGKIQLSSGGFTMINKLDEVVREIFVWYIDWFNQRIAIHTR
jgi:hypothetical protein